MTDALFEILSNVRVADGIYEMTLKTDKLPPIKAGQFANVRVPDRGELTLRRPFGIYSVDKSQNSIKIGYAVKGEGTKAMASLESGRRVQVLLPLGNGFPSVPKDKRVLLVGGGVGVLPLLSVAETAENPVCACVGFRSAKFACKTDEMAALAQKCVVATDDGTLGEKGYVADVAKKHMDEFRPDVIFACGPEIMMKSLKRFSSLPIYVSLEQRMGCGMGACLVCSRKIKSNDGEHYLRVCADGPVFAFDEVYYD